MKRLAIVKQLLRGLYVWLQLLQLILAHINTLFDVKCYQFTGQNVYKNVVYRFY